MKAEQGRDGMLRCARYAFGPNRLHYCGPDNTREFVAEAAEGDDARPLASMLSEFETMYPYLVHIATANHIIDPLDPRVVEAYWIGNALLDEIPKQEFHTHLKDGLRLKDKLGALSFSRVEEKVGAGALPHHSFQVFDVWKGASPIDHDRALESMDQCRISWGSVVSASGPTVLVSTRPLVLSDQKLALGEAVEKKLMRKLESEYDIEQLTAGDLVTMHWNVICEKVTRRQAKNLEMYTLRHITLANHSI